MKMTKIEVLLFIVICLAVSVISSWSIIVISNKSVYDTGVRDCYNGIVTMELDSTTMKYVVVKKTNNQRGN